MLTFHVITLFPDLINTYCSTSIVSRGIKQNRVRVVCHDPRDHTTDSYRKVDDTPYGGGAGMVLKPEPFFAAFDAIPRSQGSPVLLMTPQGSPFTQELAGQLSGQDDVTIICGHYEGFDERIRTLATQEISIGDFVLTGGELPALAVIDAVSRLVPGVVGKAASLAHESFTDSLLEGPQYTKPAVFRGMAVPAVLRSGNHKEIAAWRRRKAIERTWRRRPDLLERAGLDRLDRQFLESLRAGLDQRDT